MFKKTIWTWFFLSITAFVVGLELFSIFDSDDNTLPWTYYIINYVPENLTYLLLGGGALWAVMHFFKYYREKELKKIK